MFPFCFFKVTKSRLPSMTIPMAVIIVTTMLARICQALFAILVMLSMMLPATINCPSRMVQTKDATA
jgi:hypothetical protein